MFKWKVIYVNSRAEKKVLERLKQKEIECYLPLKREMKLWSDRKKMVISPLINGYVFVRPTDQQRELVLEQSGVIQYVRHNGVDAIIRDEELEALKSIEEKGYFAEGSFIKDIKVGDEATIQYGPFKGLTGTVSSTPSEDIYSIIISSIEYSLTLKVPKEILA